MLFLSIFRNLVALKFQKLLHHGTKHFFYGRLDEFSFSSVNILIKSRFIHYSLLSTSLLISGFSTSRRKDCKTNPLS